MAWDPADALPPLEDYYDHVVHHLEIELTQEQIAQEVRFMVARDRVLLLNAEDRERALDEIRQALDPGEAP